MERDHYTAQLTPIPINKPISKSEPLVWRVQTDAQTCACVCPFIVDRSERVYETNNKYTNKMLIVSNWHIYVN